MNILSLLDVILTCLGWQQGDIALLQNVLDAGRIQCAELLAPDFKSVRCITAVGGFCFLLA
jgi:hypothetical protein